MSSPAEARRRWSELRLRWLSAGLLIPPVLWVCFAGGPAFVALLCAVAAIGMHEFQGLLRAKGVAPLPGLGLCAAALLPWVVYAGNAQLTLAFDTAVVLGSLGLALALGQTQGAIASICATVFGVFYVGGLLAYGVSLRFAASDPAFAQARLEPGTGFFFALFALAGALGSDTGGFFAGRHFGRRKLAPRISPGKTVEGGLGAIAAGTACGLILLALFRALAPQWSGGISWLAAATAAATLATTAILGDLVESLLKRDAAIKDAGHIVPGVGGVLDRVDSLLVCLPVLYYWLLGYYAWS